MVSALITRSAPSQFAVRVRTCEYSHSEREARILDHSSMLVSVQESPNRSVFPFSDTLLDSLRLAPVDRLMDARLLPPIVFVAGHVDDDSARQDQDGILLVVDLHSVRVGEGEPSLGDGRDRTTVTRELVL